MGELDQQFQELYQRGEMLADAGRLSEARDIFSQICRTQQGYGDAWYMDGALSAGLGDAARAVAMLGKALELDPQHVEALNLLAALELARGDAGSACRLARRCVDIDPDYPEAWVVLGEAELAAGNHEEALTCAERAIALDPSLENARLLRARVIEALKSLATLLSGKGDPRGALAHLKTVVANEPGDAAAQINVCALHIALNEANEALEFCLRALAVTPGHLSLRQLLPGMAQRADLPAEMLAPLRNELIKSFHVPGIDYETLAEPAIHLIQRDPQLNGIVLALAQESVDRIEEGLVAGRYSMLFRDELFAHLLRYATICNVTIERALTRLRKAILGLASRPEGRGDLFVGDYAFPASLACQCFHTEYCQAVDADEERCLTALEGLILSDARTSPNPQHAALLRVLVYAMYRPLTRLDCVDRIGGWLRESGVESLGLLVKRQVDDVRVEAQLRNGIRALTPIRLEFSRLVEAEYDSSPYPRWLSTGVYTPEPLRTVFKRRYPGYRDSGLDPQPLKVLVAGCGTGRHAVVCASQFKDSQVLAIDLSAVSLAYAERMVAELGVSNIAFQQADIMELSTTGKAFHVIEAGGVLHNFEQPRAALQVLHDALEPGGVLYISTYRKAARQPVFEARALVRNAALPKSPEGIRLARQLVISSMESNPNFRKMTRWRDFFTLSESRYLLFDVPEHTFELDELWGMIEDCGFHVLGFDLSTRQDLQRYRQGNPEDPSAADRAKVRQFEHRHPSAFAGQYRCWCQKL